METRFPQPLLEKIRSARIVAVVVIDVPDAAVPMARALLEGGISVLELTLRTPAAFEALRRIRADCPEMIAGLGTVLTADQVSRAVDEGAAFAVAPGLNPEIVRAAWARNLPFAPGIVTPSDIECAVSLGCRLLKFFPAEPAGGVSYLKSMAAPYAHLGLEYVPLGGLNLKNFTDYLALDSVPAVGGSWIASRESIQKGEWARITESARAAVTRLREFQGAASSAQQKP
jgi:2-dehydro-3-deoxyphosphogluconate aldolase/(4S)-4-hydroxy-2-oxoglutarate aldolase